MTDVGVAISGGGHRATVWGWGALLALTDAGVQRDVVSISSVSGGSIANGVVANAGDYATMSTAELEGAIRPGLRVAARDGLFFFGPPTNGYVSSFLALAGLAVSSLVAWLVGTVGANRGWDLPWTLAIGPVLALVVWVAALRPKGGRPPLLPGAMQLSLLGTMVAAGPLAFGALAATTETEGGALVATVAALSIGVLTVLWLTLVMFARRSVVVDRALGRTLLAGPDGTPTRLAAVDRTPHHIFCSTELQAGDHAYLSPRLVYSYRVGRGGPGDLTLATAVQCSACLPGAFVPRKIATASFGLARPWEVADGQPGSPPAHLVLNDGGVYDNMADQWEQGFGARTRRLDDLDTLQRRAEALVVVNASKAMGWGDLPMRNRLGNEVAGALKSKDVLYDVSTAQRRHALIDRFKLDDRLDGALVHIAQSPFVVPKAFRNSPDDEQRKRALDALDLLAALGDSEEVWEAQARASSQVPTTLAALGEETTVDLLRHAHVLTRMNVYVVLGLGSKPDDPAEFARSRFEALVAS